MNRFNDYFRNAQTIIVTVAIVVWGWMYFFHDKDSPDNESPDAEVSHDIFSTCLNSDNRLVRVKVEVRNVGDVQLKLSTNNHSIAQVSPFPAGEEFDNAIRDVGTTGSKPRLIVWPKLLKTPPYSTDAADATLEPGAIHQQYHDFVITTSARIIELTSKFESWQGKTIHDVGDATCAQSPGSEAPDE